MYAVSMQADHPPGNGNIARSKSRDNGSSDRYREHRLVNTAIEALNKLVDVYSVVIFTNIRIIP